MRLAKPFDSVDDFVGPPARFPRAKRDAARSEGKGALCCASVATLKREPETAPARAIVREADFAVLLRKALLRPRIMKGRAPYAPLPA